MGAIKGVGHTACGVRRQAKRDAAFHRASASIQNGVALRLPPHFISGLTDSFNRTRLRSAVWPYGCLISNIEPMEIPGRLLLLRRQRLLFSHAFTVPTENSACRRLL